MVRRTGARVKKLAIAALLVVAGCRGQANTIGPRAGGAGTPREALERFVSAAKAQDYDAMGLIFGSAEGPARATMKRDDLEKREFIMMRCLRHDRFQAGTEMATPTPTGERIVAGQFWFKDITATADFTLVMGPNERWYVKQFEPNQLQQICTAL
jgi:hypothetical protein